MASISFLLQGKNPPVNIYVQLSLGRGKVYKRKTGHTINPKDWSNSKKLPIDRDEDLKNLKSSLTSLSSYITNELNNSTSKNITVNGKWLQGVINNYNGTTPATEKDHLVNHIQYMIDNAHNIKNSKRELGLSDNRVKAYKTFKGTITRYQNEIFKGEPIIIKDVGSDFGEDFNTWLLSQNYAKGYCGKNLSELKAVCRHAKSKGIAISQTLDSIKGHGDKKSSEEIIVLNEKEQEIIKALEIKQPHLRNACLWLELACLTGQRYSDFIKLDPKNIKGELIHIEQKKGQDKPVVIPLFPRSLEILLNDMPYVISEQKLNDYFKEVCRLAGLDQLIKGSKYLPTENKSVHKTMTKGIYPKYELVSTHIGRRSFATQHYGILPTPLIMSVTGHKKESTFLQYVRKSSEDNAKTMLDLWKKIKEKEDEDKVLESFKVLVKDKKQKNKTIKNLIEAREQLLNLAADSAQTKNSIKVIHEMVNILEADKSKIGKSYINSPMKLIKNAN